MVPSAVSAVTILSGRGSLRFRWSDPAQSSLGRCAGLPLTYILRTANADEPDNQNDIRTITIVDVDANGKRTADVKTLTDNADI